MVNGNWMNGSNYTDLMRCAQAIWMDAFAQWPNGPPTRERKARKRIRRIDASENRRRERERDILGWSNSGRPIEFRNAFRKTIRKLLTWFNLFIGQMTINNNIMRFILLWCFHRLGVESSSFESTCSRIISITIGFGVFWNLAATEKAR